MKLITTTSTAHLLEARGANSTFIDLRPSPIACRPSPVDCFTYLPRPPANVVEERLIRWLFCRAFDAITRVRISRVAVRGEVVVCSRRGLGRLDLMHAIVVCSMHCDPSPRPLLALLIPIHAMHVVLLFPLFPPPPMLCHPRKSVAMLAWAGKAG